MPSNAGIFVALAAGFLFLTLFNVTRYTSQTWEGTRLVFTAGSAAILLVGASRLIVVHVLRGSVLGEALRTGLGELIDGPYAGTLIGSLLLGLILPIILNLFYTDAKAVRITSKSGDRLHWLLTEQVGPDRRPIAVTLSDHKVYIGFVLTRPNLHPREKYFQLLPTLSGYRDEARRLHLTTNYQPFYERLLKKPQRAKRYKLQDFQILIPFESILCATVFDAELFREAFSGTLPGTQPREDTS